MGRYELVKANGSGHHPATGPSHHGGAMHQLLDEVDWEREGTAAVGLLRDLIRFDTTNPPGDEAACVELLADRLRADGLEPEVLESGPGRANLVVRLRAAEPGDEGPLLLNGHVDVVAAEAGRWRHPPFAAELADGCVWGRGAVDMKHMVAMSAVVIGLLARLGRPLRRDVIFAAVADEEAGCSAGSGWLVDEHPDKVRAEFALGEVGGFTLWLGDQAVYPVQVAEKGVCWVRATATGATGHGSMPRPDTAVVRLASFLDRVGRRRLPLRKSDVATRFVTELAAAAPRPARDVLPLLLEPGWSGLVLDWLVRNPSTARQLGAVLRDTATPTVLAAGAKTNVIPGTASAELDGRIAVGSSQETFLADLGRLAGPDIELEVIRGYPPTVAPADTGLYATIAEVVAEHHPGAVAVPSITPGFTDAKMWSKLGTACYGFAPVRLEQRDGSYADLFHGDDERVPVAGFTAGLRMLADVVARWCAA
jgi:acetylornithine deacetylase/succinyl-diaminopimelate desuccinylase-like protein